MDQLSTLEARLRAVESRYAEIETRLAAMAGSFDQDENRRLSKERATLEPLVEAWHRHEGLAEQLRDAESMVRDSDPDVAEMAKAEMHLLRESLERSDERIRELLI